MNSVLYTVRESPGNSANETIDIVLVSGIMEQSTTVVFLEDGVYQLVSDLEKIQQKDTRKKWSAVPTYGIEQIFALQDSLQARRIDPSQLPDWVRVIGLKEFQQMLHAATFVIGD